MWALLRHNAQFRRIFAGEAVSAFGDSAMFLSLAIWAKDLTGSDAAAGAVILVLTLPGLASPLLGHLVDRVHRKPLLLWMYAGMAMLVLSLLAVRDSGQLWIIYLVAAGYGVLVATPARQALLKDMLPSADALAARSVLISTREGVRIVSPVVGAGLYAAYGGIALALLSTGTLVAAAVLLALVKVVESEPEPTTERFRTSLAAGFRHLRGVPLLFRLTLAMVIFLGGVGMLEAAAFAAVDQGLDRPAAFVGVLASVQGAGSALAGLLSGALIRRLGDVRTSCLGYAAIALGLLLCVSRDVALFMVGVVLIGVGLPFLSVVLGTACHLYTPARLQGRVNATLNMARDAAQTLSLFAGAVLIGVLDYRVMYALMTVTTLACAVSLLIRPVAATTVVSSVADDAAQGPSAAEAPPQEDAAPGR
ncbi:MFS transporter [Streptomyces durbertensis]|uniref:MFS transporter n=1 Tax=Streptomyces durbertensis TaxID=2448886 RepID=A0ABR6EMP4_9ACTN|nr:MFS transporter [Streptomyces durbertensis]MBB1245774.1 MFS transporter [Streptomyces durbertensis]